MLCNFPIHLNLIQKSDNITKTIYTQICHDRCTLNGISPETTNNKKLKFCRALFPTLGAKCTRCKHSWNVHMHISYDVEEKVVRVKDNRAQTELNDEESRAKNVESFIAKLDIKAQAMQKEKEEITKICAQFGCYLKRNAITPYNDHIDDYLKMLEEVEKQKEEQDKQKITGLMNLRKECNEMRKHIERSIEHSCIGDVATGDVEYLTNPDEVIKLSRKLFDLKYNGPFFKEVHEVMHRTPNAERLKEAVSSNLENFNSPLSRSFASSKPSARAKQGREHDEG